MTNPTLPPVTSVLFSLCRTKRGPKSPRLIAYHVVLMIRLLIFFLGTLLHWYATWIKTMFRLTSDLWLMLLALVGAADAKTPVKYVQVHILVTWMSCFCYLHCDEIFPWQVVFVFWTVTQSECFSLTFILAWPLKSSKQWWSFIYYLFVLQIGD